MRPDIQKQMQDPKFGFQKIKGTYILDYECIATKFQLVEVLQKYILVEFLNDFGIRHRNIIFLHASIKGGYLKIEIYDIDNHEFLMKMHELNNDSNCNWLLYDEKILNDELNDFMSTFVRQTPAPEPEQIEDFNKK